MHIQLTDFGSSIIFEEQEEPKEGKRRNSFVGTAEFVAPEILQRGPVNFEFVSLGFQWN